MDLHLDTLLSAGPDQDGRCGSCWSFVSPDGSFQLTIKDGQFLFGSDQITDPDEAQYAVTPLAIKGESSDIGIAVVQDKVNDQLYILLDGPEDSFGMDYVEGDGGWLLTVDE